ncbi:hypothetical protein [Brachyspira hampsonii]|uniref:hypothetical protein n=1 Tax=Brachyspira hampsonii TaxID=1287055 RepID=UPI001CA5BE48|nr:hypothetical protein [Brachyspira hampsonii]MBW5389185.1 hypothetical protein [Brachyspira hampsonii]
MLKKLLITSLLFIALFTLSCEKLKEAAGTVTGSVTGIESTYAGTWNLDLNNSASQLASSTITINNDGSMVFNYVVGKKNITFASSEILKIGNMYVATHKETVTSTSSSQEVKYSLNMTFNTTVTPNTVEVTYNEGNETDGTYYKGTFIKQ